MIYEPHKFQKKFHKSDARFRVIYAGRRGGKTQAGMIEAIRHIGMMPGSSGAIIAPSYKVLSRIILPDFFTFLPRGVYNEKGWSKSEMKLTTNNGTVVHFLSADDPKTLGHGMKVHWAWWDEGRDIVDGFLAWDTFYPALVDYGGKCWVTTTTHGYDWVHDNFYAKAAHFWEPMDPLKEETQLPVYRYDSKGDQDYAVFHYRTIDNDKLPGLIDEVMAAKERMNLQMWHQEFFATLEQFSGLVYPEFDEKIHLIDPIEFELDDQYFVGIDSGYTNPTAVGLWAQDKYDNLYLVDEYYERKTLVSDIATKIKEMVGTRKVSSYIIDPSVKRKEHTSNLSVLTQYQDAGIFPVLGNNDVRAGINRVTEYLKSPRRGEEGELPEGRKLSIFKHCTNHIREFKRYEWKQANRLGHTHEEPKKVNDHAMDELRYVVMSRPEDAFRLQKDMYGRIIEEDDSEWNRDGSIYDLK